MSKSTNYSRNMKKRSGNNLGIFIFLVSLFTALSCKEDTYTVTFIYENTLEQTVTVEFLRNATMELYDKVVISPHESKSKSFHRSEREDYFENIGTIKLTFEDGKCVSYHDNNHEAIKSSTNLFNINIYEGNRYEGVWKTNITEAHYEEALADENN